MTTKEEAVKALTEAGFPAELKECDDICGSVVWVKSPIGKRDQRKVERIIKKIRYNGTYGWHAAQKG